MSPFDVMQQPLDDVICVWVGALITASDHKSGNGNDKNTGDQEPERERVYSWNASWH